jgi:hypothetical protein
MHVDAEVAQENPRVVVGMFLVNSTPASVLFDSGASHSFITSKFVAQHNIPISPMSRHMLVTSPGGYRPARGLYTFLTDPDLVGHNLLGNLCKGHVASLCNHTSVVWYGALETPHGWVQTSSELLRYLWVKMYNLCRVLN